LPTATQPAEGETPSAEGTFAALVTELAAVRQSDEAIPKPSAAPEPSAKAAPCATHQTLHDLHKPPERAESGRSDDAGRAIDFGDWWWGFDFDKGRSDRGRKMSAANA
jgi:hypothetical protein